MKTVYSALKLASLIPSLLKLLLIRIVYASSLSINYDAILFNNFDIFIRRRGKIIIERNFRARKGLSLLADGGTIHIGAGCFMNNYCSINALANITIGNETIFGEGVKIYDHNHAIDSSLSPQKHEFNCAEVSIGSNCWIGSNVVILKGVNICNNVIIGAGAVVSKNISEPGIYVPGITELRKIR